MQLILIRHGQTDWNKEYRVQGQSNLSLNESGIVQAEAIAQALKNEKVEAIYSSPLSRSLETAQTVSELHQVEITTLTELQEMDVGETDGLYYPDLKTKYPDFFRLWTVDAPSARFPGGESLPELQERCWGAILGIISRNHTDTVVVTSHFFALLTILCKVLGLRLSDFRKLNISVASISKVEFNGSNTKLVYFNETCHLET
ncbi:MAG: histidine phosphatase family protein [Chloroflexi bacterium]|nr:histidine phosphatase family protein [Chloroflexota bacterium]